MLVAQMESKHLPMFIRESFHSHVAKWISDPKRRQPSPEKATCHLSPGHSADIKANGSMLSSSATSEPSSNSTKDLPGRLSSRSLPAAYIKEEHSVNAASSNGIRPASHAERVSDRKRSRWDQSEQSGCNSTSHRTEDYREAQRPSTPELQQEPASCIGALPQGAKVGLFDKRVPPWSPLSQPGENGRDYWHTANRARTQAGEPDSRATAAIQWQHPDKYPNGGWGSGEGKGPEDALPQQRMQQESRPAAAMQWQHPDNYHNEGWGSAEAQMSPPRVQPEQAVRPKSRTEKPPEWQHPDEYLNGGWGAAEDEAACKEACPEHSTQPDSNAAALALPPPPLQQQQQDVPGSAQLSQPSGCMKDDEHLPNVRTAALPKPAVAVQPRNGASPEPDPLCSPRRGGARIMWAPNPMSPKSSATAEGQQQVPSRLAQPSSPASKNLAAADRPCSAGNKDNAVAASEASAAQGSEGDMQRGRKAIPPVPNGLSTIHSSSENERDSHELARMSNTQAGAAAAAASTAREPSVMKYCNGLDGQVQQPKKASLLHKGKARPAEEVEPSEGVRHALQNRHASAASHHNQAEIGTNGSAIGLRSESAAIKPDPPVRASSAAAAPPQPAAESSLAAGSAVKAEEGVGSASTLLKGEAEAAAEATETAQQNGSIGSGESSQGDDEEGLEIGTYQGKVIRMPGVRSPLAFE